MYYDMKRKRIVQNETFLLIAQTRSVDKQFSKKKLKAELFCLWATERGGGNHSHTWKLGVLGICCWTECFFGASHPALGLWLYICYLGIPRIWSYGYSISGMRWCSALHVLWCVWYMWYRASCHETCSWVYQVLIDSSGNQPSLQKKRHSQDQLGADGCRYYQQVCTKYSHLRLSRGRFLYVALSNKLFFLSVNVFYLISHPR